MKTQKKAALSLKKFSIVKLSNSNTAKIIGGGGTYTENEPDRDKYELYIF